MNIGGVESKPSSMEELRMDRWLEEWAQEAIELEEEKKAKSPLLFLATSILARRGRVVQK
ncbi:MAG: hypothetical protein ACPGJA_02605 [Candidatus Thalassarchaeaceae archaeon]